jgi:hypothetical protein
VFRALILDEPLQVLLRAAADGVELGSQRADSRQDGAQLRHLLTTEQSAEVTQEDEHRGPVGPQIADAALAALWV